MLKFVLGFVVGLGIGYWSGAFTMGRVVLREREQAVELGYAHHNPINGDWEWLKK